MLEHISFSSDTGKFRRADLEVTSKIAEDFFGTSHDPTQMAVTSATADWMYKTIPDYLNIIRYKDRIIGFAFLLPCSRALMDLFICKKIDEATLFHRIQRRTIPARPQAIYLCSAVVAKKF